MTRARPRRRAVQRGRDARAARSACATVTMGNRCGWRELGTDTCPGSRRPTRRTAHAGRGVGRGARAAPRAHVARGRCERVDAPECEERLVLDLNGSTILLTGGTGSFGNAFVERVTTLLARRRRARVLARRAEAVGDARPLRRPPGALLHRRRPRPLPHDARGRGRRHRRARGRDEAGPGVRVQPVRGGAHERARRAARRRRRDRRAGARGSSRCRPTRPSTR